MNSLVGEKIPGEHELVIEAEYLEMPIQDLSFTYMIRIIKPIQQVLLPEIYKVSHNLTKINNDNNESVLKSLILQRWRKQVAGAKTTAVCDDKTHEMINSWAEITEVKLHKVILVREDDCRYRGLPIHDRR